MGPDNRSQCKSRQLPIDTKVPSTTAQPQRTTAGFSLLKGTVSVETRCAVRQLCTTIGEPSGHHHFKALRSGALKMGTHNSRHCGLELWKWVRTNISLPQAPLSQSQKCCNWAMPHNAFSACLEFYQGTLRLASRYQGKFWPCVQASVLAFGSAEWTSNFSICRETWSLPVILTCAENQSTAHCAAHNAESGETGLNQLHV